MNKYQDDTFLTTPNTTPGTTPNTSHNTSHNTSGPASPPGMSEDQAGQVGRPQEIAGEIGTGMDFALPADPLPGHPIEPKLPESPDQKLPDPQLPERPVIPNLPKPRKVMPELREDYIKAYKTYFMHTGDHQIAKELGLLELRRSWAETNADGSGRLTKHAPELEYPSLSADAIKQRFETDLKSQGFDPETTFLKTDDLTRTQSKTMHPTYALTVNGEALTLPNGAALRWKPNEGLFQVGVEVIAPTNESDKVGNKDLDGPLVRTASVNPKEPIYGGERPECRTINLRLQKIVTESDSARTKIKNATSKGEKDEAIGELRRLREESRKLRAKRKCLKCTSKPTVSKETEILTSECK